MRLVSEKILGLWGKVLLKLWPWKEGEEDDTFGEGDLTLVCV